MKENESLKDIKTSIESIIGTTTILQKKKRTKEDIKKEQFIKIIETLEFINVRSNIISEDFSINLFQYDEVFHGVIEDLIELNFGKDIAEIINFYIYDRINDDGSLNILADVDKKPIPLANTEDLWEFIQYIKENAEKISKERHGKS